MSVLVIGGAGYIGSHMVLALQERGESVVVLDNLSTGFRWAVPEEVPFIIGDFGEEALIRRIFKDYAITSIIHFAAKIIVPESLTDPLAYYLNNSFKVHTLLKTSLEEGLRHFVFSSTAAVYGEPPHVPVQEEDPLIPINPYGRSKVMVEWMLEDLARAQGLSYAALRYFNVCGADPRGRTGQSTRHATHLIKVAAQTALGFRPFLEVFGTDYPTRDGSCLRDYVQVTDLVEAHALALDYLRRGKPSLVCNVGYGTGFSVLEVLQVVKQVSGVHFPVHLSSRRPGDPAALIASNARIKSYLNWQPAYEDLALIVQQTLDWERRLHNRAL